MPPRKKRTRSGVTQARRRSAGGRERFGPGGGWGIALRSDGRESSRTEHSTGRRGVSGPRPPAPSIDGDGVPVVAGGQPAQRDLVDAGADRLDAAVAEGELADARVPAAELLAPDGVG